MPTNSSPQDPHAGQPVLVAGAPLAQAKAAMLMVHGRGASAEDILELSLELRQPQIAYLAPQAADNAWYPYRFMEPIERNEPWLSSALAKLGSVLAQTAAAGIPAEKTIVLGFSQGACLGLEFVARNPRRYGGAVGWSGGLIGPEGGQAAREGSLEGTPVALGCSNADPYIPAERVRAAGAVLAGMGAKVDVQLYPGLGHTVNADEVRRVRALMESVLQQEEVA